MPKRRRVLLPPVAFEDPKPWTHGPQQPVRVVLHDTESHDTAGIRDIEGIFNFWHDQRNPDGSLAQYGAHFVVDADGNVGRGAAPERVQWHVGGLNTGSIGVEQIGFASFTRMIWKQQHRNQLYAVARILAWANYTYGIPLKVRDDPREPGVTTHRLVGQAGIDTTGHTDPGAGYPLGFLIMLARMIRRVGFKRTVAATPPRTR